MLLDKLRLDQSLEVALTRELPKDSKKVKSVVEGMEASQTSLSFLFFFFLPQYLKLPLFVPRLSFPADG